MPVSAAQKRDEAEAARIVARLEEVTAELTAATEIVERCHAERVELYKRGRLLEFPVPYGALAHAAAVSDSAVCFALKKAGWKQTKHGGLRP